MAKHARLSWTAPVLLLAVILAALAGAALFSTSGHVSAPVTPSASAPALRPAPPATSAPAPPQHVARYVVAPGDTLWHIAATRCGDPLRWTALWHANKIANPDRIFPGEVIILNC